MIVPIHFGEKPGFPECSHDSVYRLLGQPIKTDYRTQIQVVVPWDEPVVSDRAEASALPKKEDYSQSIQDLLCFLQHPFGGGHVYWLRISV